MNAIFEETGKLFDPKDLLQIGIVVKDLDASVAFYENVLGIGPFDRIFTLSNEQFDFRGSPADQRMKIAMTYFGDLIIELIEYIDGKSVHAEFLEEKGEGVDHICFRVEDLDAKLEECKKRGLNVIEYNSPERVAAEKKGRAFAYIDSDRFGGLKIELIQLRKDEKLYIRKQA